MSDFSFAGGLNFRSSGITDNFFYFPISDSAGFHPMHPGSPAGRKTPD